MCVVVLHCLQVSLQLLDVAGTAEERTQVVEGKSTRQGGALVVGEGESMRQGGALVGGGGGSL